MLSLATRPLHVLLRLDTHCLLLPPTQLPIHTLQSKGNILWEAFPGTLSLFQVWITVFPSFRISKLSTCPLSVCAKLLLSCQTLCGPWAVVYQAPLSMGFFRQEYWSGLSCPPPGDLPNPGMEAVSLVSPALAGGFFFSVTTSVI